MAVVVGAFQQNAVLVLVAQLQINAHWRDSVGQELLIDGFEFEFVFHDELKGIRKACYSPERQACSFDSPVLKACKLAVHLLNQQGHQHQTGLPQGNRIGNIS
jgi:hypothetical protein